MINGLTLQQADSILKAALTESRRLNLKPMLVVVLDARVTVKAVAAEDRCGTGRYAIAFGKANGALAVGMGSRSIAARAAQLPAFFQSLSAIVPGGVVPMAGGVLVRNAEGDVLGAVGTTGDIGANDELVAIAGITAAGLVPDAGTAA